MKIAQPSPDYQGCESCVHSDDSDEICLLRGCIHAISKLDDCYLPKNQPDASILGCKDCIYHVGDPISDGRFWCTIHAHYMYYCSMAIERRKEFK